MKLFELSATLGLDNQEFNKAVKEASNKGEQLAQKMGATLKEFSTKAAQLTRTAAATATALASAFITQSTIDFSEYEQLVGGIDTLFKDSSKTVQEYANKAYMTAGLSANKYMEQVTSFSATLLRGLGGDTEAAAKAADMAITDMADNVNRLGSDMAMVQNAYEGFSRQNFTMLDNLKLGYSGTQQGMADLINDSGVLGESIKVTADTVKDVSFDKIIEAIHIIQRDLGITGATAEESANTVSGSIASLRAAWTNLTTGAGAGHDMKELVDNLLQSINNVAENLKPVIQSAATGLMEALKHAIEEAVPMIENAFIDMWNNKLPGIVTDGANALIAGINDIFGTNIPSIEKINMPTWAEMQQIVSTWWSDVKGKIQTITTWTINSFEAPAATGEEIREVISAWWQGTGLPAVKAASAWALNLFDVPVESDEAIAEHIKGWWDVAGKVVASACTWTLSLFGVPQETADNIYALISSWWSGVKDIASAACQIVVGIVTGDLGEAWAGVKKWWDTLVATYGDMLGIGFDIIAPAIDEIKKQLEIWWANVLESLGLLSIEVGASVHTTESGSTQGGGGRRWGDLPSHADGLDYVPYDNYVARLHQGEAVLTADEARGWRSGESEALLSAILAELKAQRDRPIQMDGQSVAEIVSTHLSRSARTSLYSSGT